MGVEFAISIALGILAAALTMVQSRWPEHPRVRHLCGIGAVVSTVFAAAIIVMAVLGAVGMNRVQSIGMPIGAAIFLVAAFWPLIDRTAGYRSGSAPRPVAVASEVPPSSKPRELGTDPAFSVTGTIGRDIRPDRAYFAARMDNGTMWLEDATNPEPFGGPPSHTLADQAYGTWTLHNDAATPALNVTLSFAYQWQRMGQTETLSLGRTAAITIPRIEGHRHVVVRIANFTSEYVLHISPAENCTFEAPGDPSQRPCIVQGANPGRRENVLTLFPAARKDPHPAKSAGVIESAPARGDVATATVRHVRTGETHTVSSLGVASDQEQTEYLLNLIDLYARSRGTERGWLSALLDPATRIGAPFPPRDKQYDYPRAIKLLAERGLVRILQTRKREYVDMIGLSIHEDFEFERLNRLATSAVVSTSPTAGAASVADAPNEKPRLLKLARLMREFVANFRKRSPAPPPPRPTVDPDDQDYDDKARIVSDLLRNQAESDYNNYHAAMGLWFFNRFHEEISALRSHLAPTAGADPRLRCFLGTYDINALKAEDILFIAAHIENVANGLHDSV